MAQQRAFDEGAGAGPFVGVELIQCLEVQAQGFVLRATVLGVEDQIVGGDGQGDRNRPENRLEVTAALVSVETAIANLATRAAPTKVDLERFQATEEPIKPWRLWLTGLLVAFAMPASNLQI